MKTVQMGSTTKVLMKEGDELFKQGDQGDSAYMIVYGHLDVLVDNKKKGAMRDGELFGELALLLDQKRSATIIAGSATELVSISKDNLDELLASGSDTVKRIINELCIELSKRAEFQKIPFTRKVLDENLKDENQIITKLAQQIFYRLEKSTTHLD
jgi:CRP-like cAMP-binding protein